MDITCRCTTYVCKPINVCMQTDVCMYVCMFVCMYVCMHV